MWDFAARELDLTTKCDIAHETRVYHRPRHSDTVDDEPGNGITSTDAARVEDHSDSRSCSTRRIRIREIWVSFTISVARPARSNA